MSAVLTTKKAMNLCRWLCLLAWVFIQTNAFASLGRGHVTLLTYDAQKRPLTETYADTGDGTGVAVVSYAYNALEKVQRTDAKGQVTTYHYDVRHQLRATKYWGANATLSNTRSCSYDAAGRLLTVSETANAAAAVSQVYDALGRVTAESSVGQTQVYRYDINGNRISAQYSTGRSVSTRYDALGRPETITEGGRVTQYEYDLAGRAMRQDLGNGQRTLNAYDAQGRLEQRTCYQTAAATAGTSLVEYQWRHDAHGNVLRQQETWPAQVGGVGGSNQVTTMAYDDADRLTSETITPATGVVKLTVNGYDDADNRDVKDEYEDAVLVKHTTYASDARNRLSAFAEFDAANNNTQLKAVSYGYDKDGNRALRQELNVTTQAVEAETTYAWDQDNRLLGVALPDGHSHAYGYDYRTRRISQQESAAGSVVKTTDIVFSGGLSLAEYEAAGAGPPPAAPTVEYQRGPDMGGGVGGMLYSLRASGGGGSTIKYSLSNGRGDIVAQSDQTATLTWAASYEAFGKRTSEAGANADKQRSNSKDEDPTGLVNEGFRYRDLETGAFISRDPAGFVDGPNVYAYVKQNPWTGFDPKGLSVKVPRNDVAKVESFMKTNGVSGHSVTKDTKSWFSPEDKIDGGPTKSAKHTGTLTGEIVAALTNSDHEFAFKSFKDFERHVNARVDGVNAAKGIKAQYSMGRKNQVVGKDGVLDGQGRLVPVPGKTYKEAMESTLNDPKCVIDCSKAAGFPLQIGMLNQGDTIADRGSEAGLSRRDSSRDTRDWIPGDWGYLREYGTDANFAGPVGENVLYLGGNEWVGHDNPRHVLSKSDMDARTDIQTMRRYPSTGLGQ